MGACCQHEATAWVPAHLPPPHHHTHNPSPPLTPAQETYAERFYAPEALTKGAELFRDERRGAVYAVPDGTEVEAFRAAVEELPAQDSPELFGLHSNADLTFRRLQARRGRRGRPGWWWEAGMRGLARGGGTKRRWLPRGCRSPST